MSFSNDSEAWRAYAEKHGLLDERSQEQRSSSRTPHERRLQNSFFKLVALHQGTYPELELLHSSQNGQVRTRKKSYDPGVLAGFPDVLFPVPRGPYCGLAIELKATYPDGRRGQIRDTQRRVLSELQHVGWAVACCWSAFAAWSVVEAYLKQTPAPPPADIFTVESVDIDVTTDFSQHLPDGFEHTL